MPHVKRDFLPFFHPQLPKACTTCLRSCPEFVAKASQTWTKKRSLFQANPNDHFRTWVMRSPGLGSDLTEKTTRQGSHPKSSPNRKVPPVASWLGRWAQGLPCFRPWSRHMSHLNVSHIGKTPWLCRKNPPGRPGVQQDASPGPPLSPHCSSP